MAGIRCNRIPKDTRGIDAANGWAYRSQLAKAPERENSQVVLGFYGIILKISSAPLIKNAVSSRRIDKLIKIFWLKSIHSPALNIFTCLIGPLAIPLPSERI